MRRRFKADRRLSAEAVVRVYQASKAANVGASPEVTRYAIWTALEEHGYTPLDVFRARIWLRRGKPADYRDGT
jgi:hypothetical protein